MRTPPTAAPLLHSRCMAMTPPTAAPLLHSRCIAHDGRVWVYKFCRLKKSGDVYALVPPITRANNLLLGMTWVDTFGDLLVVNLTKGNYAALHFHQCGWFGGGRHKVAGTVYSADGEPKLAVCGKWNEQMSYMYVCRRLTPCEKMWRERLNTGPYSYPKLAVAEPLTGTTTKLVVDAARRLGPGLRACDAEGAAVKGAAETEVWRHAGSVKADTYAMSAYAR